MIFNNRVDVFEENRRLREELEQEKRFRKEWQERCLKLEKELHEVKTILNRILNPNTPSSQIPDTKNTALSPNRNPSGTKPRGKPLGANGGARKREKIDKKEYAICKNALIVEATISNILKQKRLMYGICRNQTNYYSILHFYL